MINNLPTHISFKNLAQDCFVQVLNNLFQIGRDYNEYVSDLEDELDENHLWEHHKGDLRTCLVLIYQGLELYLKGEVCKTSSFLLLETPRHEWPTNLDSKDKDFNELFTIAGDQLLRTFNAVCSTPHKKEINDIFNEIRKRRNLITHSSEHLDVTPKYLIVNAISLLSLFEGIDKWWDILRENIQRHPLFGYGDYDFEVALLGERLEFYRQKVGSRFLSKYSKVNLVGRRYHCPSCSHDLEDFGKVSDSLPKWAFLHPNTSSAKKVICYSCKQKFNVLRQSCTESPCLGNVIDEEGRCLTCFSYIDF